MEWVKTSDIKLWADRRDCQETLPQLVRMLIRATSNSIKNIKFPSGDNVLIGGWDGILEVIEGTDYFPSGISVWEFGTNINPKGKADDDYDKRSLNPLGFNPADTTFVFVTPRLWTKGEEWIEEKKKNNLWKDIRVINAEMLEEWLETAPTVAAWLAVKHLGKYPAEGRQPTDDFWEEWSTGPKINLKPQLLLGGREKEIVELFESMITPSLTIVESSSREESLAFVIACFQNENTKSEDFFARSLIVDNHEIFRQLSVHKNPLILIPRFENLDILHRAIRNGHHVILPIGADSINDIGKKITLPLLERDSFIRALVESGITPELATKYSKESARNIIILRRQLDFISKPIWAEKEQVRDIIPALLVGRWDENFEADRNIIARLANEPYEEYAKKLMKWLNTSDSPIVKIGSQWRLTSSLDVWTHAAKYLTSGDFNSLRTFFLDVMREIDPALELVPDQQFIAPILGKTRQYSGWIQTGVAQSLVLVAVFVQKLKIDLPLAWVDNLISELLSNSNSLFWKSISHQLPLMAEASPNAFLNAIEHHLAIDATPIMALFDETTQRLFPTTNHSSLLWALEGVAWLPDYLARSALILSQLARLDRSGALQNRPINSLIEIFKTWHYQTLASDTERIDVLRLLAKKEKEVAWVLLCNLLPVRDDTARPTYKMRWRLFDESLEKPITFEEIEPTHSAIVEILLSIFDGSEAKLSQLIKSSVLLSANNRGKILSYIETNLPKINQVDYSAWDTLRKILSYHRYFPDTQWALPESELVHYEKIYNALQPTDEIQKSIWMFNEQEPDFLSKFVYQKHSYEEKQNFIHESRVTGLKNIYMVFGIEEIKRLSFIVKEPYILGETLAYIVTNEADIFSLCDFLNNEPYYKLEFIHKFIFRKFILNGIEWVFDLYNKLNQKDFSPQALAQLLIPINQYKQVWDFLYTVNSEVRKHYWLNVRPYFNAISQEEKLIGLTTLLEFNRYFTAIDRSSYIADEIPSPLIVEILYKAATERANEEIDTRTINYRLSYNITILFDTLDKKNDVELQTLVELEWLYLPVFSQGNGRRNPKFLYAELSKSPEFFIEVLKYAYPNNIETQPIDTSDEQFYNRAKQARVLLYDWKQTPHNLVEWITTVRNLAHECDRLEIADSYIGQILAQYPERNECWPPDEICEIIEEINTDSLKRGFSAAIFNKRGLYIKSLLEGGEQERILAQKYRTFANNRRNKFPNVASVLDSLVRSYEQDAIREDETSRITNLEYE